MKFLLFITLLFINSPVFTQSFLDKTSFHFEYGFQEHDVREFDWPGVAFPNRNNPEEDKGTYQFSLVANYHLINKKFFILSGGIGFNREINTFSRPFEKCFTGGPCELDIRTINRYYKNYLSFPIQIKVYLPEFRAFFLSLNLTPSYWIKKEVNELFVANDFKFNALEFSPGVGIRIWRLHFSFNYRVFQIKEVDRVNIYPSDSEYHQMKTEKYNLDRFGLRVAYHWK